MGAEEFSNVVRGKTAREAFELAVENAQYEHGHGGYSGTIAEKDSFKMVYTGKMLKEQAYAFRDTDESAEKWGPAYCIELDLPLVDGKRTFLFFGLSSS